MAHQEEPLSNWITSKEAAVILTERSGHPVTDAYVRRLGNPNGLGLITIKQIDGRTRLYSRKEIEDYTVKPRGNGDVRRDLRAKKQQTVAAS